MSYQQLEARLKALLDKRSQVQKGVASLMGAQQELRFLQDQMLPGLDHELLEGRMKKMQDTLAQANGELMQVHGAIQETQYWIHMTPEGQEPAEALQQLLKEADNTTGRPFVSEGPRNDLEALMHLGHEAVVNAKNGEQNILPPLLVAGIPKD